MADTWGLLPFGSDNTITLAEQRCIYCQTRESLVRADQLFHLSPELLKEVMPSIMLCMGTRPEIIKMAPVITALHATGARVSVLHTGQHDDMAWPLYEFFSIRPDHILNLDRKQESLSQLGAQLLSGIDRILNPEQHDCLLVHGDTLSAHMGALAAFMKRIPVGHVEAGLRSGESNDPFPEEINRQCIARLASMHFAPTEQARENLLSDGIPPQKIHVTGNTIVDAVRLGASLLDSDAQMQEHLSQHLLGFLSMHSSQRLILVTAHRRENWGQGIRNISLAVAKLLLTHPDTCVVWPMHSNSVIEQDVRAGLRDLPAACASRLHLCGPLGYPDLLHTLRQSRLVLTDSGGIQEEAVTLQVPVLILRNTTERPEVIESGWGELVAPHSNQFIEIKATEALSAPLGKAKQLTSINPFGEGNAAKTIAELVIRHG